MATNAEALRPLEGHVTETEDGNWWSAIQELVGIDFEEQLEDAVDYLTEEDRPALFIGGDVFIDGDASSADLAMGKAGYDPDKDRDSFTMVVLGSVTVTGGLDVVQNAQLVVSGSVKARTIRGCSANLIAKGAIEASELACFEESDEGGIVFGKAIRTPLVVRLGSEFDVDIPTEGEVASYVIDEDKRALTRAAAALTRELEARYSLALYVQIDKLIEAGRASEFSRAYRAELSGSPIDIALPVAKPGTAVPFYETQETAPHTTLCGIAVDGKRIYVAGGLGRGVALASDDGGRVFRELRVSVGTGLRKFHIDGDTIFACGERGMLARSIDNGETFEVIDTGASVCMNTILRGDGGLWACGDFGAHQSKDDGKTWSKVDIEGEISRPQDASIGTLLPSDKGYLYIAKDGNIRKTSLEAGVAIWAVCATNRGSIVAVGAEGVIYRSADAGKTFDKISSGVSSSLENVACTSNGLLVVVGQDGVILRSADDGASFERVPQTFTNGWFFGAAALGEQVLVAGADRLLLTVG